MINILYFFLLFASVSSHSMEPIRELVSQKKEKSLTAEQVTKIFKEQISEEIGLCDGGCCENGCSRCKDKDALCCCNAPMCAASVTAFFIGASSIIAAAVLTPLAFPFDGRTEFNPVFFKVAMSLWGLGGASAFLPPGALVFTNLVRKFLAYLDKLELEENLEALEEIPNMGAPLAERFLTANAKRILSNRDVCKMLNPEQVLALHDSDNFSTRLREKYFTDEAEVLVAHFDILSKQSTDSLIQNAQNYQTREKCRQYPFFGIKLQRLLPKKHRGLGEYEPLLSDVPSNDDKDIVIFNIDGDLYKISRSKISTISETIKNMFADNNSDSSAEINLILGTVHQKKMLMDLAALSDQESKEIFIKDENKMDLLALDKAYEMVFLHDKLDTYFSVNGVPGNSLHDKYSFALEYKLTNTEQCLAKKLLLKFQRVNVKDSDFQCLHQLNHNDRDKLLKNLNWNEHWIAFTKDPPLLKFYWEQASRLEIKQMKDQILTFYLHPANEKTFITAFNAILPDEIFKSKQH